MTRCNCSYSEKEKTKLEFGTRTAFLCWFPNIVKKILQKKKQFARYTNNISNKEFQEFKSIILQPSQMSCEI